LFKIYVVIWFNLNVVRDGTAAPGNSKSAASSQCRRTRRLVLNAADPHTVRYLSSEATVASGGIGTSECPFRIQASPGQRIRLSLVAFIGESRTEDPDGEDPELAGSNTPRPGLCYEVGTVTAGGARASDSQLLTACGLPTDRTPSSPSVLYQSDTSNITVQLYPIPVLQRLAPFVIKFEGNDTVVDTLLELSNKRGYEIPRNRA